MKEKIAKTKFINPLFKIINNVTATPENNSEKIKELIVSNKLETKIYERILKLTPKFIGECDVIFSIGYLKKIDPQIIDNYEIINLHPSLLPKYKGLMTHKRMLINNENLYGFTIHLVNESIDDGKILFQKSKKVNNLNEESLIKAHKKLEYENVYKALIEICIVLDKF